MTLSQKSLLVVLVLVRDKAFARLLESEDFPAFGAPTKTTTDFMQHLEQIGPPRRIEEVPRQLRNCDLQLRPLTQRLQDLLCSSLARLLGNSS